MKRTAILLCMLLAIPLHGAFAVAPENAATMSPAHPPTFMAETAGQPGLSGKVVETMNAGGYTYVCLEKEGVKTWVAVPETQVIVGSEMSFRPGHTMENFTSKTLNRTFDAVVFSPGPTDAGVGSKGDLPSGHPSLPGADAGKSGTKPKKAPKVANVKVGKAKGANAYRISELYAKGKKLKNKKVLVRGTVIKFAEGIMDRNWIHLQDGSGNEKKGTNDIVVTTQDTAEVGDVVTVRGKISADKDFGAGYAYKIIIEDGKILK